MSRRHKRKETLERALSFQAFVASHPPRMPASFTHREWKRVVSYAKIAYTTGWNSGQKYDHRRSGATSTHGASE